MADERLVHFDWTEEAMEKGKAPRCADRTNVTDELGTVTCEKCLARMVDIIQRWEVYGPGRKAGPR